MNQKHQRPTLKTLSIMTGLSLSTVSLALRGGENLKEETRKKVLKAAQEIGYVPDRAGVRLRTGRTNSIGLILDGREDSVGFSRKLIHGISVKARERNINLNVYPQYERSESEADIKRIVEAGLVDGVILTHTEPQDQRAKLLLEMNVPFVTHGRTELFTPHAYHDFDSGRFVEVALDKFVKQGASNVIAVIADNFTFNHQNVKRAFEKKAASLDIKGEIFEDGHGDAGHISAMRELGRRLLDKYGSIDGILCDNELVAIGIATGLRDCALAEKSKPIIISKQTSELLSALFPEAIGIREAVYESGAELARLLFALLDGEDPATLQTLSQPIISTT